MFKNQSLRRSLSALMFALSLAGALVPVAVAAQTCTPTLQATPNVGVDYIRDADGDPVALSGGTERREHARISTGLAQDLGILNPDNTIDPRQIRVIVDTYDGNDQLLASGLRATGNFTAIEAYVESSREIEIYAENRDPSEPTVPDEDSGYYKLFEDDDTIVLADVELSVLPLAPSATTTINPAVLPPTSTVQHFCEPTENGGDGFVETVALDADKDFVLVVPHGGEIEAGTSEQVDLLTDTLADYQVGANIWETAGFWDPAKLGSEHFHITSKALEEASFPGLATLTSQAPFASGQPFRYAASLHGFGKYKGNGLVFGGHAHPETKCYVARAIQQRVSDLGLGKIAYYVYDHDGNVVVDMEDERDKTIPEERGDVGLTGRSSGNIVNRLAPNPNGADTDFGGMQIEESVPLRDDAFLRDLVARRIGHAFGQLIDDLTLVDPASTTWCDALQAGPAAPAGAVSGRVWLDDNEDGIQDGGEAGVSGVTVSLLEAGVAVDSTVTGVAGAYAFTGLTEASYAIRVTAPPARGFGPEGAGLDEALDSDVDEQTGESLAELVTADGTGDLDLDVSLVPIVTAEIGDRAWIDVNGDGVQDLDEPGLAGVTVTLLADADGSTIDTAVTDSAGLYAFTLLTPGDYRLRFDAPTGYALTTDDGQANGGTAATDSDPDDVTGETGTVSVLGGQVDDTVDAGFTVACFNVTPVAFGSTWMVSDAYDQAWLDEDFSETGWQPMQATVGYGSDVVTEFDPSDLTVYMRLTFEVDDPSLYDSLDLALYRDDGAAVYLNGTEVLRSNLPAGPLAADTPASSYDESTVTTTVAASLLEPGDNVLAVEVHNRSSSSSDLMVDVELSSRVCRPCLGAATIPVDFATYIQSGDSSPNGGSAAVKVKDDTERTGLIRFDLAGAVPAGAEVLHAQLDLFVEDGTDGPYRFYPALRAWDEATATYAVAQSGTGGGWEIPGAKGVSDRDDRSVAALVAFDVDDVLAEVVLNVEGRALIEEWAATPSGNRGLIIPGDEGADDDLEFASDDDLVDPKPVFKVVYATGCGG